jgi:hypothetical protein
LQAASTRRPDPRRRRAQSVSHGAAASDILSSSTEEEPTPDERGPDVLVPKALRRFTAAPRPAGLASFKNGLLTVTLPKTEVKETSIPIRPE